MCYPHGTCTNGSAADMHFIYNIRDWTKLFYQLSSK